MSYDLMVFDPEEAPHDRAAFLEWYKQTTEWSEGHSYDDPNNTTLGLRNWFDDIRRTYPPMNGPLATDDYDNLKVTDYSIGHHAIYAAFAWSEAEEAYPVVRELTVKHAVGFYDVSGDEGDGEIHFPGDKLRPPSGGAWRAIAKDFKDSANQ
ncbi:MAG: hypothetical protein ACTHM0_01790 [Sphingomonas sp.]